MSTLRTRLITVQRSDHLGEILHEFCEAQSKELKAHGRLLFLKESTCTTIIFESNATILLYTFFFQMTDQTNVLFSNNA